MPRNYRHLGLFSDWVDVARRGAPPPVAVPGLETRALVAESLGFAGASEVPTEVRVESTWERDGVAGEEVSWSVGYGPRTRAFVLKPAGSTGPLPGVLALHSHDALKFHGLEKIADGPLAADDSVVAVRDAEYGGRAFANELAKEGFVVLAHDVFLWGSRRWEPSAMPDEVRWMADAFSGPADSVNWYNGAAWHHEHVVEKYCGLLGTTMAGVVASEDRTAVAYLASRSDVAQGGIGCVGLSGGGCRAALLQATCNQIKAAVIVAMMSTYDELLDDQVAGHTWMFFPTGWPRHGDWPDLAACRAPSSLLVQYNRDDDLFTLGGMEAAHERLRAHYRSSGDDDAYTGQFYDGPHKFDVEMQEAAFSWLRQRIGPGRST